MPVEITRTDLTGEGLREAAAGCRDGNQARRALAIALLLDGWSRRDAASACGMDRQTLRDWVHRYNGAGLAGLVNRRSPGRPPRLSAAQMEELGELVEEGPDPEEDGVVRWRRIDLKELIAARYDVEYHVRSVGKLLHRLGFSHMSARPRHPQADAEAQEAFKKTSQPL